MYEVYFVLILCLYVGGLVKFCQRASARVMIQDQTYTCFNRRTRNNTSACVHCLSRWTKVFMKTPEHYFKTETQIKPRLTHDCSVTCICLLLTYCLPTELLLVLVTVVSSEDFQSAQQHHTICASRVYLHQPQHRLYTYGFVRRASKILLRVKITLNIKCNICPQNNTFITLM